MKSIKIVNQAYCNRVYKNDTQLCAHDSIAIEWKFASFHVDNLIIKFLIVFMRKI